LDEINLLGNDSIGVIGDLLVTAQAEIYRRMNLSKIEFAEKYIKTNVCV
jgi:hypothetical protein